MLQTLSQDLKSDFDILGPHYISEGIIEVNTNIYV